MAFTLSCTSSTVAITPGQTAGSGTVGGTANLAVTDTSTNRVVATSDIGASGSISQDGKSVTAGTSSGFTLTVTWNTDGSASGSAAGTYNSTRLGCNVPVSVDHGGKRHHATHGGKKH